MSTKALALLAVVGGAAALVLPPGPAAAAPGSLAPEAPKVSFEAPAHYVAGSPYTVTIEVEAGPNGSPLAGWILSPSAFLVDGVPIGERTNEGQLQLPPGARLTVSFDLEPFIETAHSFELGFARGLSESKPIEVAAFAPIEAGGESFMERDAATLGEYLVLLSTNRGPLLLEMWPDRAPMHVRNFLDLAHTGFYDGITFHRVIEGFMIQGGDPQGTGMGGGPRTLKAEFTDARHVRGVLSAARLGHDVNSATSQFFVMHRDNLRLDGQYSAFGKLVSGYDTLDAIATTRTAPGDRPVEPQVIEKARVLRRLPARPAEPKEQW